MISSLQRQGSILEGVTQAIRNALSKTWTALPGIIQSFDPEKLTCTVQPAIKGRREKEDGGIEILTMPLLLDCPVVFPRGGGCSLTFPLKKGDECLVIFADRGIDYWWKSGGVQMPPEPRIHDLSDGFVIPGPYSQPQSFGVSTSAVQLRTNDGKSFVEIVPSSHNVKIQTSADVEIKCVNLTINASASTTINSPQVTINGNLSQNTGSGSGSPATFANGATTPRDFTAAGISLNSHTHGGTYPGSGSTGGPQ